MRPTLTPEQSMLLHHNVDQLNAAYAAALDDKRFEDWPLFFVENGQYKIQARENFDRNLPLALMSLESRGMMKDRVYGITQTIFHAPYYTRHVLSPCRITAVDGNTAFSETSYAVFRTKPGNISEVYNVGRYIDTIQTSGDQLQFASRLCVYDSEMILNSLIYPV